MRIGIFTAVIAAVPTSALAQSSGGGGEQQGADRAATIDLPLVGEIELPSWLSFLGSSGDGGGSGGQGSAQGGGSGGGSGGGGGDGSSPPPAVVVTRATIQSVGDEYDFIGRIEAIEEVTLQSRVAGFIEQVFFEGGDQVSVGDDLFKIEDAQYEAALLAAQAQLAGAEAQAAEAERALARARELRETGTIPQAELDQTQATFESARATRLQAEAQVRQAQLNLDYTSIKAPIDGVISEPLITRGNFVSAASGTLAEIVQLDPIWGTFPIGENRLATWRRIGPNAQAEEAASSAASDESGSETGTSAVDDWRLTLRLPDEQTFQTQGQFAFVGNTVDPSTGTIEVRVRFSNPDGTLLPNENVTLVATERDPPRLPVIPQAAVQLSRDGRSVFLLDEAANTVRRQPIETGKALRGSVAVRSGVSDGDIVVVQGVQNLSDGATVRPSFQDGNRPSGGESADGTAGGGEAAAGEGANGGEGSGNSANQQVGSQSQSETRDAIAADRERSQTEENSAEERAGSDGTTNAAEAGNGGESR